MSSTLQLAHHDDPRPMRSATDAVGRLVLRALEPASDDAGFLARRAAHAVGGLPEGPERRYLGHVLRTALTLDAGADERTRSLVAWAGHLESRGLLDWSGTVLERARTLHPGHAELTLHAARVARKSGRRGDAGRLYDEVIALEGGGGRLARMADVGHALVADDAERALGRALRRCLEAGDREAAAVAQEARAECRRRRGDGAGAVRDYLVAAARYGHPADVGRIGHEIADLLLAAGDPLAVRQTLIATEELAHPQQAARARARLLSLCRSLGDEIGERRWSDAETPTLVSLTPRRPDAARAGSSRSTVLERWVRRLRSLSRSAAAR
jgi:hypothetical protein